MRNIVSTIILFSACSLVQAQENYYPPQSITCIRSAQRAICTGFNHWYLIEQKNTDENIPPGYYDTYYFKYGIAFDPDRRVIYTYQNAQGYRIALQSSYSDIQPTVSNPHWIQQGSRKHFYYTCQEESGDCPITNLPFYP